MHRRRKWQPTPQVGGSQGRGACGVAVCGVAQSLKRLSSSRDLQSLSTCLSAPRQMCKSWRCNSWVYLKMASIPRLYVICMEDSLQIHKHCHKLLPTSTGKFVPCVVNDSSLSDNTLICSSDGCRYTSSWAELDSQVISLKGKREYKRIKLWKKGFSFVGCPQ